MICSAEQLLKLFEDHLATLNLSRQPQGLYAPIGYTLAAGGKRIRPMLLMMAYNLYKEDVAKALPAAAGIEVYHNYTLLHDDIMDCADMRRGRKTVHKVWDENTAILSGDAMLVLSYQCMALVDTDKLKEVMDLFSATALQICEGQQYDVDFEKTDGVTQAQYIEMIRLKTAVLIAASLKTGALLAGAPPDDAELLYQVGINVGLAFQLKDDYLDAFGDGAVFGKNIGGDIVSNKKTFLMIKALELSDTSQKNELNRWISAEAFDPQQKIKAVIDIYHELGVDRECEETIHAYYSTAKAFLLRVSVESERKTQLMNLLEHLMSRVK